MILLFWRNKKSVPVEFDPRSWPGYADPLGLPATFTLVSLSSAAMPLTFGVAVVAPSAQGAAPNSAATALPDSSAGFVSVGPSASSVSDFPEGGTP